MTSLHTLATHPLTVQPLSGRLCQRALTQGKALVGVLSLPQDFTVEEGRSYLLVEQQGAVSIVAQPFDDRLTDHHLDYDVDSLLRATVWRGVTSDTAITVKFMEAFPAENTWVVYGASNRPAPPNTASHTWWDIGAQGLRTVIAPLVDAAGSTMGQLLTTHPLWPNARGELHTLSKLHPHMRKAYHAYHQLLAASTKDPALDATLEATVAKDGRFASFAFGRIERDFCGYLAALEALGGLTCDAPQTAETFLAREALSSQAMEQVMDIEECEHEASVTRAPRMR